MIPATEPQQPPKPAATSFATMLHAIVTSLSDSFLSNKGYKRLQPLSSSSLSSVSTLLHVSAFVPGDTSTMSDKTSSKRSSSVSRALKRIPHKASRLVCITDPSADLSSARPQNKINYVDADMDEEAMLAGIVQRPGNSGSETDSSISGGYSLHSKSSQASSLVSYSSKGYVAANPAVITGPIISPDELERALAQTRLSSELDSEVLSDSKNIKPQKARPGSIKVPPAYKSEAYVPHSIPESESETDYRSSVVLVPRSLSPPPEHFRRRVLSGSEDGLARPYTSPMSSPLHSPLQSPTRSYGPGGSSTPVRLHELLSSTSLIAPPLRLYDGAKDPLSKDGGVLGRRGRPRVSSSSIQRQTVPTNKSGGDTLRRVFSQN